VSAPARFGQPRHHHRLTDSTNDRARELARAGAPDGTVVTASEQSAGRGRQGRTWTAPAGGALLSSILLRPLDLRHRLLPLSVPLAVCEAAEELGAGPCQVKWPNDVWLDGRKLAGVLIEARPPDWAMIGIGLNVAIATEDFPPELRETATSIGAGGNATPTAAAAAIDEALAGVCAGLERWVEADDAAVLAAFERRDALRGREIRWTGAGREDGRGHVEGVDERGNLLVRLPSGERLALGSGEAHLLPA
jgi:BirA family biotin operon repressor/biotin-[acetyl-CoA-carboxylase] ligase